MPFMFDDKNTEDANHLKDLCQGGYVIRYSTRRRTPLFTAERLNGAILSSVPQNKVRKLTLSAVHGS